VLCIGGVAVDSHKRSIKSKLDTHDRVTLHRIAAREGPATA
jgi:DNA-binding NarL/FixJ family response regulator